MPGRLSMPGPPRSSPARRCSARRTIIRRSRRSAIRRRARVVERHGGNVDRDHLKRAAAKRAVEFVERGMVVGLGPGLAAEFVVEELASRVAGGLALVAIPTSEHTAGLARGLGIPLASFAEHRRIDLAIDGADEVARTTLDLIKGRGGALLREKIVAAASRRFVVMVDDDKLVDRLGTTGPLPVE